MRYTYAGPAQDRARRRREYLLAKANAYAVAAAAFFVTLVVLLIFSVGILGPYSKMLGMDLRGALVMLGMCLPLPIAALVLGVQTVTRRLEAAKSVPYVPPVERQVAQLPPDEILLRGSRRPPGRPDELLRPTRPGSPAPACDLLRAQLDSQPAVHR